MNTLICNNQGLISTRIKEADQWNYTTPNVRAKWDIKSIMLTTYKYLNLKLSFLHVKSHQDNYFPVASQSFETKLNVEADKLATE
jgi:hypothetical protein